MHPFLKLLLILAGTAFELLVVALMLAPVLLVLNFVL